VQSYSKTIFAIMTLVIIPNSSCKTFVKNIEGIKKEKYCQSNRYDFEPCLKSIVMYVMDTIQIPITKNNPEAETNFKYGCTLSDS
jgi:hypothetical protein